MEAFQLISKEVLYKCVDGLHYSTVSKIWVDKKGPEFKYFFPSIIIMKFYPALFKQILHSEDFSWIILHRCQGNTEIYKW